MNDLGPDTEAVIRLVVAALAGAVVGLERELADQPAGLRTHMTVALGAALFGVVGTLGFREFLDAGADGPLRVDPTRVPSQVVVGVGFLGAGVIFRQGVSVRNLTTAASLWVTAAIGLTVGVGDVGTAAVGTAVLVSALALLRPVRDWLRRRFSVERLDLEVVLGAGVGPSDVIDAATEHARVIGVRTEKVDGRLRLGLRVQSSRGGTLQPLLARLAAHEGVRSVTIGREPDAG